MTSSLLFSWKERQLCSVYKVNLIVKIESNLLWKRILFEAYIAAIEQNIKHKLIFFFGPSDRSDMLTTFPSRCPKKKLFNYITDLWRTNYVVCLRGNPKFLFLVKIEICASNAASLYVYIDQCSFLKILISEYFGNDILAQMFFILCTHILNVCMSYCRT